MSVGVRPNLCGKIFEYAARHEGLRWPGFLWDAPDGRAVPINRELGRSPSVQNMYSCGMCGQLAAHAELLVQLIAEAALPAGKFDHDSQADALVNLLRSFYACDPHDGPAIFRYHAWCIPDAEEFAKKGIDMRIISGTTHCRFLDAGPASAAFDTAGYRSMPLDCRRLNWTAGPEFDTQDLRVVGVAADRRTKRGALAMGVTHCEHIALAPRGNDLRLMLRRGDFPYQRGKTHETAVDALQVHDYPLFNAIRLRPLRVEEGQVVQAVQDVLTVLFDEQTGAVARISTKHGLYDGVILDAGPEESHLWRLVTSRGANVPC